MSGRMSGQRKVRKSVLELIGGTPIVELGRVAKPGTSVLAKVEAQNPSGSVKDRPALAMVDAAEREGILRPGSVIVEATSGNTGIALAMIAAVRGYRCVLVMPEDMSVERRRILRAYGSEIVITPAEEGMAGAVQEAMSIVERTEGAFMPRQFDNPANPEVHARTTAREILEDVPDLAAFVAGVGSGGTLTGVARVLKAERPSVRIVAVEPAKSAVLSGGEPGLHSIQGLGAGFVPTVLDRSLIDEIVCVTDIAADKMTTRLAREEGLLVGPSSGANVHAACELAARITGPVVTILCDSGERYLFG
ncbi:Cysteine synthase [Labilithrix luteola]|uniref:Cysteine synthase n=1 Tax=Labilithrix luteola TaxID=1391654 RepID=A0A0K1Q7M5_9BACT|nr:cysteine synthase A [Labilithrix luteola]AKV01738.1 Cysteine synthase [Labilithrix luteola]